MSYVTIGYIFMPSSNDFTSRNSDLLTSEGLANFRNTLNRLRDTEADALYLNTNSPLQSGGNALKNILSGALTGLTSAATFASGMTPFNGLTEGLARVTRGIEGISDELGSPEERARQRIYENAMAIKSAEIKADIDEKVRSGKLSETAGNLERISRETIAGIGEQLRSGAMYKTAANAVGSVATDILVSGGVRTGLSFAKNATELLSKTATRGAIKEAAAKAAKESSLSPFVNKYVPWGISVASQEGGSALGDQYLRGLETSFEELQKNSPEFRRLVKEYEARGLSTAEAMQKAREDVSMGSARLTGVGTGLTALALSGLTAGWGERPLSRAASKAAQRSAATGAGFLKRLRNAVTESSGEFFEEGGTEGVGQYLSNLATQKYLNENQDLYEGVGKSTAEGIVGALGISVPHTAVAMGETASNTTKRFNQRRTEEQVLRGANNYNQFYNDEVKKIETELKLGTITPEQAAARTQILNTGRIQHEHNARAAELLKKDASLEDIRAFLEETQTTVDDLSFDATGLSDEEISTYKSQIKAAGVPFTGNGARNLVTSLAKKADTLIQEQRKNYSEDHDISQEELTNELRNLEIQGQIQEILGRTQDGTSTFDGDTFLEDGLSKLPEKVQDAIIADPNYAEYGQIILNQRKVAEATQREHERQNYSTKVQETSETTTQQAPEQQTNPGTSTQAEKPTQDLSQKYTNIQEQFRQPEAQNPVTSEAPALTQQEQTTQKPTQQVTPESTQESTLGNTESTLSQNPQTTPAQQEATTTFEKPLYTQGNQARIDTLNQQLASAERQITEGNVADAAKTLNAVESNLGLPQAPENEITPEQRQQYKDRVNTLKGKLASSTQAASTTVTPEPETQNTSSAKGQLTPTTVSTEQTTPNAEQPPPATPSTKQTRTIAPSVEQSSKQEEASQVSQNAEEPTKKPQTAQKENSETIEKESYKDIADQYEKNTSIEDVARKEAQQLAEKVTNSDPSTLSSELGKRCTSLLTSKKAKGKERAVMNAFAKEAKNLGLRMSFDDNGNPEIEILDNSRKNSFASNFPTLSKLFTPVRRLISLWDSDLSPVEVMTSLLDPDILENLAKETKQTNIRNLLIRLSSGNPTRGTETTGFPDSTTQLWQQISTAIHGELFNGIRDAINKLVASPDFARKYKKIAANALDINLSTNTLELNKKLADILTLATIQWIAKIGVQGRALNEDQLARLGFDPNTIQNLDEDEELPVAGLPTFFAVQGLGTTITKFLGVAEADAANADLYNAVVKEMAQLCALAAEQAGFTYVSTEDIQYTEFDDIGQRVVKTKQIKVVSPMRYDEEAGLNGPDLTTLFRAQRDIMEQLVSHKFKNSIHLKTPQVKETIAHTTVQITKEEGRTLNAANEQGFKVNMPMFMLKRAIGGLKGIAVLMHGRDTTNSTNRKLYTKDAWQRVEGQLITYRLALDYIDTLQDVIQATLAEGKSLTEAMARAETFFSNVITRNGRIMQEGAATWQSNKLLRELLNINTNNETIDLTNTDLNKTDPSDPKSWHYRNWLVTLAQKMGVKVGDVPFEDYKDSIQSFLKNTEQLLDNDRFKDLYNAVENGGKTVDGETQPLSEAELLEFMNLCKTALRENIQDSNSNPISKSFKLESFENINGFLEAVRYAKAVKAKDTNSLKNWSSHIFLEIDAKTSGSSLVTQLFSPASGYFTPEFFKTSYRTGNYYAVNITTQQAISADTNSDAGKILNGATDPYSEAAHDKVITRLAQIRDSIANAPDAKTGKIAKNTFKAMLTLFKAGGWLENGFDDIDAFLAGKTILDPKTQKQVEAIRFTRSSVKPAFMIIPYGSQARGTTGGSLRELIRSINGVISNNLQKLYDSDLSGVYQDAINAIDAFDNKESFTIDTETTGLNDDDEIVQVALKQNIPGKGTRSFNIMIELSGKKAIPQKLNGITNPLLKAYNDREAEANKAGLSHSLTSAQIDEIIQGGRQVPPLLDKKSAYALINKLLNRSDVAIFGHNIKKFDIPHLQKEIQTFIPKGLNNWTGSTAFDTLELSQTYLNLSQNDKLESVYYSTHPHLNPKNDVFKKSAQHLADTDVEATFAILKAKGPNTFRQAAQTGQVYKDLGKQNKSTFKAFSANGVSWENLYNAFNTLMGTSYDSKYGEWDASGYDVSFGVTGMPKTFPTPGSIASTHVHFNGRSKNRPLYAGNNRANIHIVPNFSVNANGLNHLTNLFTPLFGEAIQEGTIDVLGEVPVANSRKAAATVELATIIARGVQATELSKKSNWTTSEKFNLEQSIDAQFTPNVKLNMGNQFVVNKTRSVTADLSQQEIDIFGDYASAPSDMVRATSGVSGIAYWTHAHDGTVLMHLLPRARAKGVSQSTVHDSSYTPIQFINTVAEILNNGVDRIYNTEAPMDKMEGIIQKLASGLRSLYSYTGTDEQVLSKALQNLAKGKSLEGKKFTEGSKAYKALYPEHNYANDIKANIKRYAENVLLFKKNQLNLFPSNEETGVKTNLAKTPQAIDKTIKDFVAEIKNSKIREKVFNYVRRRLPRHIQHYSAPEVGSNKGDISGLTPETIAQITNEVNALAQTNYTWDAILSMYCNALVQDAINTHQSTAIEDAFRYVSLGKVLSADGQKIVSKYLKLREVPELKLEQEEVTTKHREIYDAQSFTASEPTKNKLGDIFKIVKGQIHTSNRETDLVFANVLHAVRQALTLKGTNIVLIPSEEALAVENSDINFAPNTNGFWRPDRNTIYVVDRGHSADWSNPVNARTLVHEAIHAVLGQEILAYTEKLGRYNDPKTRQSYKNKLETDASFNAIKSFHKLINTLLSGFDPTVTSKGEPAMLTKLKRVLYDTQQREGLAAMLDEAFAYLNSDPALMRLLDDPKLSPLSSEQQVKHRSRFRNLLASCQRAINRIWKTVFGLDAKKLSESDSNTWSFTKAYGLNTMVALKWVEQKSNWKNQQNKNKNQGTGNRASLSLDDAEIYSFRVNGTQTSVNPLTHKDEYIEAMINTTETVFAKEFNDTDENSVRAKYRDNLQKIKDYTLDVASTLTKIMPAPQATQAAEYFTMLLREDALTPEGRASLARAYSEIARSSKFDPYMFAVDKNLQTDRDRSSAIFDVLTKTRYADTSEYLHTEFQRVAMLATLSNFMPEVRKAIDSINVKEKLVDTKGLTTSEKLFASAANHFIKNRAKRKSFNALNDKSVQEAKDVIDSTYKANKTSLIEKSFDEADYMVHKGVLEYAPKAILAILGAINKLLNPSKPFKIPGSNLRTALPKSEFENVRNSAFPLYLGLVAETLRNASNKLPFVLTGWVNDLYVTAPSKIRGLELFKQIKGFYDANRKRNLEDIPKDIAEKFNIKLTRKHRELLTHTLGDCGFTHLELKNLQKFYSDPKALQDEINTLINKLNPKHQAYYLRKIQEAVNYTMGLTNAAPNLLVSPEAIARKFGDGVIKASAADVNYISQLLSLYSIKALSKEDKQATIDLWKENKAGMDALATYIKQVQVDEEARSKEKNLVNSFYNFMPTGNNKHSEYIVVPKVLQSRYESYGYKFLADYKNTIGDTSEKMIQMYTENKHNRDYKEGSIQFINQTARGFVLKDYTRREFLGSKLTDQQAIDKISSTVKYSSDPDAVNLIPLYDNMGELAGFERSVPKQYRKYITEQRDIFTGAAQYALRQQRENLAEPINKEAVDISWEEWDKASPEEKKHQFIDVFHSNNKEIQNAAMRINAKTRRYIIDKYGGNHFYIKKDMVFTQVGFQRKSIADVWDNQFFFTDEFNEFLANIFDSVLGKRARHYLINTERLVGSLANIARNTIIIRSLSVPAANLTGNIISLNTMLGIPVKMMAKLAKEGFEETERYLDLSRKIFKAEQEIQYIPKDDNTGIPYTNADSLRLARLQNDIDGWKVERDNLSIAPLVRKGMFSTISDQGRTFEEVDLWKQKLGDNLITLIDKTPDLSKKLLSNIFMTQNSEVYKGLLKAVNYSDWVCKVIVYKYLTQPSKVQPRKFEPHTARQLAEIMFIDYDQFTTPGKDYLNSIGGAWFMMYKYRICAAAMLGLMLNPSRALLGTVVATSVGAGTALSDNVFVKLLTGKLGYSLGFATILNGLSMHPLAVLLGILI